MDHVRQLVVHKLDLLGSALFGACHVVDDLAVTVVDALEHHVLGTESQQRVQQFGHGGVIEILPGVVALGQDARFGQVRHQHVRAVRQSPHRLAQFRRVRRVHLPGVAHNRVDQPQRGRIFSVQALDDGHLVGGAEEAAVHAIQLDVLLAPGVQISGENVRRVMEREHGVLGVCGEQGRRHRAHVAAGRRQDRDRRGQRALAIPAHVVHGGHARNVMWVAVIQRHIIGHSETPLTGRQ